MARRQARITPLSWGWVRPIRHGSQQLDRLLAHAAVVCALLVQYLGDALAFTDEAEQDVLGADVIVTCSSWTWYRGAG